MQKNDTKELNARCEEWISLQQELAARVRVPSNEIYCPPPIPLSTVCRESLPELLEPRRAGEFDAAFVHRHFLIPKELLQSDPVSPQALSSVDGLSSTGYYHFAHEILARQIQWDMDRQREWVKARVFSEDSSSTTPPLSSSLPSPLKVIGGVDISTLPGTSYGVACLSIHAFPSLDFLGSFTHPCELEEPYISGFLAFREARPVMELLDRVQGALREKGWMPQLLLVDGCGVNHPRRCGLASHLGVLLGIPTIGCSKKMLSVGGLSREDVEEYFHSVASPSPHTKPQGYGVEKRNLPRDRDRIDRLLPPPLHPILIKRTPSSSSSSLDGDELVGYAVQTSNSAKRCIFVSPGNDLGYATSVGLVLKMCKHRIPEPIRTADLLSRDYIRFINPQKRLMGEGKEK